LSEDRSASDGPAGASYPVTLTIAADDPGAELAMAARLPLGAEATIGLKSAVPFPPSGQIDICSASGTLRIEGGASVSIEKGSGTITVTERTRTRIVGTFTAMLTGRLNSDSSNSSIRFTASGTFDTGAPVGPLQELGGSPIPANLFSSP
jgi:hypothetical protein